MIDREKAINDFEAWCIDMDEDCPVVCLNALAILKEQDTVKPVKARGYNPPVYTHYKYECEECKSPILYDQPYCCGCGKKVRWEAER